MKYGVPYQGSKSSIAERIVDVLPSGLTFYDLFSGGCAMSHCAALSGKWERIVVNDIDPFGQRLFFDAIRGDLPPKDKFVSRSEFLDKKSADPYVSIVWSFGNNQRDYMYSKVKEPEKLRAHTLYFKEGVYPSIQLEHLVRRRRIDCIRDTMKNCDVDIEFFTGDYRSVPLDMTDGVVYCDIPYIKTNNKYRTGVLLDYSGFYEWARAQKLPVYVSSYDLPSEFFDVVMEIPKIQNFCAKRPSRVVEKLFKAKKQ